MSDVVFLKDKELMGVTPVENIFISEFLPAAPELALKAYLYGLLKVSNGLEDDIAEVLGCTEEELIGAFSYWEKLGLVEIIRAEKPMIRYFNVKEAMSGASLNTGGAKYGQLVEKLQGVLGTRILTGAELARIYDWVEVFGFEQDAAVRIVARCLDRKGARVSVSYMDKTARSLAEKGAFTLDAVESCFREEDRISNGAGRIYKRWNRTGTPTEDEIALYEKWTREWGFSDETIDLALPRMTAASRPNFKYLDVILEALYKKGSVDENAVREADKREAAVIELSRSALARAGIKSAPTKEHKLHFEEWHFDRGMSAELIYLAADYAKGQYRPFAFMKDLIESWLSEGISSVSAARESFEKHGGYAKNKDKKTRSLNYMHGKKYSEDELKELGISLGEEFYDVQ